MKFDKLTEAYLKVVNESPMNKDMFLNPEKDPSLRAHKLDKTQAQIVKNLVQAIQALDSQKDKAVKDTVRQLASYLYKNGVPHRDDSIMIAKEILDDHFGHDNDLGYNNW